MIDGLFLLEPTFIDLTPFVFLYSLRLKSNLQNETNGRKC